MAYFFYTDNGPDYLTVIADMNKIKAVSTETFEEYLVTNRLNLVPGRIDIGYVIWHCLKHGYPANVKCLYYDSIVRKNKDKMITAGKFLKYDGLPSATITIPIIKEPVAEIFKQYCQDKVQIIDVVIALQDGTKLHGYKALNAINRVEAFTWEGSKKGMYYEEGSPTDGYPNVSSMDIMAYKKEIVEREIICRDSVTRTGDIMICEALGQELKKHKFKGLRLESDVGSMKLI